LPERQESEKVPSDIPRLPDRVAEENQPKKVEFLSLISSPSETVKFPKIRDRSKREHNQLTRHLLLDHFEAETSK
jgi:hypothetical protein